MQADRTSGHSFGAFLQRLREERGWSIREAARRCGLSHSYLVQLEAGSDPRTRKPISVTVATIQALARGFGVPERVIAEQAGLNLDDSSREDSLQERLLRVLESLAASMHEREETERRRIEVETIRAEAEVHREEALRRLVALLEAGDRIPSEPPSRAPAAERTDESAAVAGAGGKARR